MQPLDRLAQFRQALYQICTRRPAALLDLIDAVAQVARPHSLAELSLAMQRHWSSLYDALDEGALDLDQVRLLLAQTAQTAAPYRVAERRVVVLDHTGFPRPAARTVAERERYPGPNGTRQLGHRYSWLSQLVDADSSWLAPLDVDRIGPGETPVAIALTHLARLAQASAEPLLAVADREYGVNDVLRVVPLLPGVSITVVARVRSNLVFYQAPPPRQPGHRGRTRVYGARVQLNDPATWPQPQWTATEEQPGGERVELRGWGGWHPPGHSAAARAGAAGARGARRWAAQVPPAAVVDGGRGAGLAADRAAVPAALAPRNVASASQRPVQLERSPIGDGGAPRSLDVGSAAGVLAGAAGARTGAGRPAPVGASGTGRTAAATGADNQFEAASGAVLL